MNFELINKILSRNFAVAVLITGLVMGLLVVVQLKTDFSVESNFPTEELEAKELLIKDFLDEQAYLKSRIVTLREEINKVQDEIDVQSKEFNFDLLNSLKADLGLTEVKGRGLEITLNDSKSLLKSAVNFQDAELIQASDLRDIVNLLRASRSEAIAINNQRILYNSSITSVGNTVLVNNSYITPPFLISAVGNTDLMLQRLLNVGLLSSIYERKNTGRIIFEIALGNNILVPIFNGNLKTNFLNLVQR